MTEPAELTCKVCIHVTRPDGVIAMRAAHISWAAGAPMPLMIGLQPLSDWLIEELDAWLAKPGGAA